MHLYWRETEMVCILNRYLLKRVINKDDLCIIYLLSHKGRSDMHSTLSLTRTYSF